MIYFEKERFMRVLDSNLVFNAEFFSLGQVALAVAEKLIELGAIPITFSDTSGHILEPQGFDMAKLKTMQRIKQDRGARVSTSSLFPLENNIK